MTPERLIKLGAGLQRMADRLEQGQRWTVKSFVDVEGVTWEYTKAGWQAVIS
jgi:hypothetical protein